MCLAPRVLISPAESCLTDYFWLAERPLPLHPGPSFHNEPRTLPLQAQRHGAPGTWSGQVHHCASPAAPFCAHWPSQGPVWSGGRARAAQAPCPRGRDTQGQQTGCRVVSVAHQGAGLVLTRGPHGPGSLPSDHPASCTRASVTPSRFRRGDSKTAQVFKQLTVRLERPKMQQERGRN